MELSNSNLLKELKIKFDIGSLKKLILFSEDMDFIQNQSTIDTIVKIPFNIVEAGINGSIS